MCAAVFLGSFSVLAQEPVPTQETEAAPVSSLTPQQYRDSVRRAKLAGLAKSRGETVYFYDLPMQSGLPVFDTMTYPLDGFQIYDEAYHHNDFRANRGNFGMPDQLLEYMPRTESGFRLRTNPFSSWFYTPQNTPFFQTKNPYTTLYFVNNFGKDFNYFKATYYQNVARGLNMGVDFRVYDVYGNYINSRSNQYNVRFSGNYISRDSKYRIIFGYFHNVASVGENGGLKADSLFFKNSNNNRLRMPVNMEKASNRWRENRYFFKQSYHFYKTHRDTIPENNRSYGFLTHEFEVEDLYMRYRDQTTASDGFYDSFLLSPDASDDRTNLMQMTNRIYYSSADMEYIPFGYRFKVAAGFKNEYIRWHDQMQFEEFVQFYPFVRLQFDFADRVVLDAYADLGLGNYGLGDMAAWVRLKYLFKNDRERSLSKRDGIQLHLGWSDQTTDLIYVYHLSNHHYWDANATGHEGRMGFGRQSMDYNMQLDFLYKGWWARLKGSYLDNYTFFKKNGPETASNGFWVATAVLGKNAHIGKYVGLDNLLMFSYVSDERYMHLPLFSLQENLYGIIPIKNIAKIQIGLEFIYNTSYYADAYEPSLASYYWQDEVKTGNFFFMNVFLNLQIKRANFFVKGVNIAEGLFKWNYMQTPHYPLLDRCFRFGISWRFFD
ncbi:MAG: putative porin [Bacteroides sp.]|nr:putative porin [Bacteroides sp.]